MDIQVILVFILALLTVSLMFVGYHVINVLKEFRLTLRKTNEVLENVHTVTDTVSNPVSSIISLVSGITKGFRAAKSITSLSDDLDSCSTKEEKKHV